MIWKILGIIAALALLSAVIAESAAIAYILYVARRS